MVCALESSTSIRQADSSLMSIDVTRRVGSAPPNRV
jgi:hypothetical protein